MGAKLLNTNGLVIRILVIVVMRIIILVMRISLLVRVVIRIIILVKRIRILVTRIRILVRRTLGNYKLILIVIWMVTVAGQSRPSLYWPEREEVNTIRDCFDVGGHLTVLSWSRWSGSQQSIQFKIRTRLAFSFYLFLCSPWKKR